MGWFSAHATVSVDPPGDPRASICDFASCAFPPPPPPRFDKNDQQQLVRTLMSRVGFDSAWGRLDESAHPFCGGTPDDVRMTTMYLEDDFTMALLATMHETGHAMCVAYLIQSIATPQRPRASRADELCCPLHGGVVVWWCGGDVLQVPSTATSRVPQPVRG